MSFTPIWVCFLRFYWKRSLRHDIFWTTWHKSFGTTSCIYVTESSAVEFDDGTHTHTRFLGKWWFDWESFNKDLFVMMYSRDDQIIAAYFANEMNGSCMRLYDAVYPYLSEKHATFSTKQTEPSALYFLGWKMSCCEKSSELQRSLDLGGCVNRKTRTGVNRGIFFFLPTSRPLQPLDFYAFLPSTLWTTNDTTSYYDELLSVSLQVPSRASTLRSLPLIT